MEQKLIVSRAKSTKRSTLLILSALYRHACISFIFIFFPLCSLLPLSTSHSEVIYTPYMSAASYTYIMFTAPVKLMKAAVAATRRREDIPGQR